MQRQSSSPLENSGNKTFDHQQAIALNVAYNALSIVTMPVELVLRIHFGSQYFFVLNPFFTLILLTIAAAFTTVAVGMGQMIPFVHLRGPIGLFGLGSLLQFYLLAGIVHGIRVWRRMIHPELEHISTSEGPPFSLFRLLPKGESPYITRIFYEPIFVWVIATVLSSLLIIQSPLALYLELAAICLSAKQYIQWFKTWAYMRNVMDVANAAPIIAKIVNNTATDDERASVQLASLPKNLPPDIQKATMAHIARAYSIPKEDDNA